jgi:excisionase family DNA binding protein
LLTFLAVYVGKTIGDAALVAITHDPTLVAGVMARITPRTESRITRALPLGIIDSEPDGLRNDLVSRPVQSPARLHYTPEEAYRAIGIGRTTMYRLLREGKIPAMRIGRKWLIPRSTVEHFHLDDAGSGDEVVAS